MLEVVIPLALPRRVSPRWRLFQLDAVAKGRILQLEAGGRHLHQRGIGHRRFTADVGRTTTRSPTFTFGRVKTLTVAVVGTSCRSRSFLLIGPAPARGNRPGCAAHRGSLPSLVTTLAASASGCPAAAGPNRSGSTAKRGGHPGLPVDARIDAGESQQSEPLLSAEPLTMGQGIGHLGTEGRPALRQPALCWRNNESSGLHRAAASRNPRDNRPRARSPGARLRGLGDVLLIPMAERARGEARAAKPGAGVIGLLLPDRRRVASVAPAATGPAHRAL